MNEEILPGGSQAVVRIDGTKIRALRERKDLTQLYVATVVGVTTDTISRWENRRYPTIKQENALKLAEVLDVELAEILDVENEPDAPLAEEPETAPGPADVAPKGPPLLTIVVVAISLLIGAALLLKPKTVNEGATPIITARRLLPSHVAPGQSFPVLIRISVNPPGTYSMIVRESVPLDCLVIKGLPSYAALDEKSGELKWIGKATDATIFAYLARPKPSTAVGGQLTFAGAATLKQGGESARISIKGDDTVALQQLHWADDNGDHRIDDEEILAVYDQLEAIAQLGVNELQTDVEDIWAAGGYRWDETTGGFVIVP
ncbi:MAG: helix-turn-helix domain-containing protein [Desulfobulbaceae bacterium]|nr:helix-turn-helix domain-containing protein [Desulfobulbaceae bacterium]